ncbi:hypothetical protein HDU76_010100, partial [Blyttiomyces sp. JEL0837]
MTWQHTHYNHLHIFTNRLPTPPPSPATTQLPIPKPISSTAFNPDDDICEIPRSISPAPSIATSSSDTLVESPSPALSYRGSTGGSPTFRSKKFHEEFCSIDTTIDNTDDNKYWKIKYNPDYYTPTRIKPNISNYDDVKVISIPWGAGRIVETVNVLMMVVAWWICVPKGWDPVGIVGWIGGEVQEVFIGDGGWGVGVGGNVTMGT